MGPDEYFEDGTFIPMALAEEIMEEFKFATHRDSGVVYVYQGGVYRPFGESVMRAEAQARLEDSTRNHYVNEVVGYIQRETYTDPEKFDPPKHLINVRNGVLDLNTLELKPHNPNPIFINQLPADFKPGAECPKIMKFLSEILYPEDIPLVQEIAGYCLYRDYPFAKAVMLLGSGNNGKSTLLRLIGALLGDRNIATPSLHDLLSDRFSKAELFGRFANIHADIPAKKLGATGPFKMLTGQDLIYAQQKHRNPFTFRNYAKLLYSANELPATDDMSEAFWRRWVLIDFPNTFPEDDPRTDPNLIDKLTTPEELSGFLNWALEGLRRLLDKGHFTTTKTMERIKAEWILRTDSLRAFVMQHVRADPRYSVPKEGFMGAYNDFCENHEVPPIGTGEVTKRLPQLCPRARLTRPGARGEKRPRVWDGIRLAEPYKSYNTPAARGEPRDMGESGVPRVPDESRINSCFVGKTGEAKSYVEDTEKTLDTLDTKRESAAQKPPELDQRERVMRIYKIIGQLEDQYQGGAPVEEIRRIAESEGISSSFVDVMIDQGKREGFLYEPKPKFVARAVR